MAMNADPAPTVHGSTRALPEGRDYDYFCDAVSDVYVGVRPERPSGAFPADFTLIDFGATQLGFLSTPGTPAFRDRSAMRRLPDDALFLNFSRAPWTLEHLGRSWDVPGGMPLLLDNDAPFRLAFDPRRRMHLYSLRIPRAALGAVDTRSLDERALASSAGAHLAAQFALLADMMEAGRTAAASAMSVAVVELVGALSESADTPSASKIATFKASAHERIADRLLTASVLARTFHCSVRTVQLAFAAHGETFGGWLTSARLELAHDRLRSPEWAGRSVAQISTACGFTDVSTFYRAYRRRFGASPGAAR
ncbi:helix-turn-helix transcriptional regulator [Naasia lichenicola]|uniref:AraC family transcriptional regulator n=1 Tax=Naasia lichenicola TaxID=2565933 RepID=A0A4S4FJ62_9MICO|nr:AraC family transcriptional regulator [Naasia lichenicola]THG29934.1 AraC family transcriptional regulator [Naasia lichenicola]